MGDEGGREKKSHSYISVYMYTNHSVECKTVHTHICPSYLSGIDLGYKGTRQIRCAQTLHAHGYTDFTSLTMYLLSRALPRWIHRQLHSTSSASTRKFRSICYSLDVARSTDKCARFNLSGSHQNKLEFIYGVFSLIWWPHGAWIRSCSHARRHPVVESKVHVSVWERDQELCGWHGD